MVTTTMRTMLRTLKSLVLMDSKGDGIKNTSTVAVMYEQSRPLYSGMTDRHAGRCTVAEQGWKDARTNGHTKV